MKKALLIVLIISLSVLVTGCDLLGGKSNPETDDYYRGTEGIRMQFLPGTPPPRVHYYSDGSTAENSFEVVVELQNRGASEAVGATYISGYDPNIVRFDGVNIQPMSVRDCVFDLTRLLSGSGFQFYFDCYGVEGGYGGSDQWNVNIREIGRIFGIDWLSDTDVAVLQNGEFFDLSIGWDNFGSIDILYHGRALAMVLSSIDWRGYNGFPYNGGQEKSGIGILRGDNYNYPGGETGYQTFVGRLGHQWPAGLDDTTVDFLVTQCYGYATYAAPEICIDPAPYDETEKACRPQDYSFSGSQGAPVAITRLKQEPTNRKVFMTFTIQNVGGGKIFNLGYLERCSPYFPGRMDSRHTDVVYIGDIRIGNQRLRCTPGYEIRLVNGVGTFSCEYDMEYATAKSAYKTNVVLELWYGYQDTIRTSTYVKRVQ